MKNLLAIAFLLLFPALSQAKPAKKITLQTTFVVDTMNSCMAEAKAKGLSSSLTDRFCTCGTDYMRSNTNVPNDTVLNNCVKWAEKSQDTPLVSTPYLRKDLMWTSYELLEAHNECTTNLVQGKVSKKKLNSLCGCMVDAGAKNERVSSRKLLSFVTDLEIDQCLAETIPNAKRSR